MNTLTPAWHDRARELLATGLRVQQVADEIGKSDDMVRIALNINGAADRHAAKVANAKARKAKQRAEVTGVRVKITPSVRRSREGNAGYMDKPAPQAPRPVTLPRISILLTQEPEPAKLYRLAPVPSFKPETPGVQRWRDHHERMLRRGAFIATPDVVSGLHR